MFTAARREGDRLEPAYPLLDLAAGALRLGLLDQAIPAIEEALTLVRDVSYKWMPARTLATAASTLASLNDPQHVVTLLGTADRLFEEAGFQVDRWEQAESERHLVDSRDSIGDEAFHKAWKAGREMSLVEAVDLALSQLKTSQVAQT